MTDLDTTLALRKPEIRVLVDREAANDLGLPVGTVADTLRILVGGMPVSNFKDRGEQSTTSGSAPARRIAPRPPACMT